MITQCAFGLAVCVLGHSVGPLTQSVFGPGIRSLRGFRPFKPLSVNQRFFSHSAGLRSLSGSSVTRRVFGHSMVTQWVFGHSMCLQSLGGSSAVFGRQWVFGHSVGLRSHRGSAVTQWVFGHGFQSFKGVFCHSNCLWLFRRSLVTRQLFGHSVFGRSSVVHGCLRLLRATAGTHLQWVFSRSVNFLCH